jgi:hypothetical protein
MKLTAARRPPASRVVLLALLAVAVLGCAPARQAAVRSRALIILDAAVAQSPQPPAQRRMGKNEAPILD